MAVDRLGLVVILAALFAVSLGVQPSRAQYAQALRQARGAAQTLSRRGGDSQAQPAQPQPKPASPKPATPAPKPASPNPATTPPVGRGEAPPAAETIDPQQLIEPAGFDYKPEGRRDPFVSLVRPGRSGRGGTSAAASRPAGIAGLSVAEISLRGTVRGRDGFVAILEGADKKAYIVRPGDKLFDGMIRTISQNDLVVVQQVNDPLSLEKQREVRKVLRQTEANQ